ncbi:MAG: hypothetical protein WD381_06945 [Balneolaceae bacterium]
MHKLLKIISIVLLVFSVTACGSNGDSDSDTEENEDVTQGMEQYWMDQREEFIELTENQIEEWKETLENSDSEQADELNVELDKVSEKLSDIEQDERHEWEDSREEIVAALNDIRREIEDME